MRFGHTSTSTTSSTLFLAQKCASVTIEVNMGPCISHHVRPALRNLGCLAVWFLLLAFHVLLLSTLLIAWFHQALRMALHFGLIHIGIYIYIYIYIESVLKDLPNLGVFTLVRYFQHQITEDDVVDSSSKHIISPMITRGRIKALEFQNDINQMALDNPEPPRAETPENIFRQLNWQQSACKTPEARYRSLSSSKPPSSQKSPLAGYGEPRQTPSSRVSSNDRAPQKGFPDNISTYSGVSADAAKILYAATADEMIVNTSLILLLNAIAAFCPAATAEWSLVRWILRCQLGAAALEARTDGYLQGKDNKTVVLVEVKARARSINRDAIRMQETTQMVTLLAQEGFPDTGTRRYGTRKRPPKLWHC